MHKRVSYGLSSVVAWLLLLSPLPVAATIAFVPGHFYTTNYFAQDIVEYDDTGSVVGSIALPSVGDNLRGLAFGPDDLLYVSVVRGAGFAVVAIDASGTVHATYPGSAYAGGNIGHGKLALDDDAIYVAVQNQLTKFTRAAPGPGTSIYSSGFAVMDVVVLPSGHLLVASEYGIDEITTAGTPVRHLPPPISASYTNIQGIEYDAVTDSIFVTMLGYTGFSFQLMRVNGATGALENHVTFTYANDLFLTIGGELVVGSRTDTPRVYSRDLVELGELGGGQRMFVTQKRPLGLGIAAKKLIVADRPTTFDGGQLRFFAEDAAVTKGSGVDPADIGSELTVAYGSGAASGGFRIPAGDAGWLRNDATVARFVNHARTGGATRARMTSIRPGRRLRLSGRGTGDTPIPILAAGDPGGSVFTSYCIDNGGRRTCLCSEFPSCRYAIEMAGAAARLVCSRGLADPHCTAIAPRVSTTTTSTSTTSTTSSSTSTSTLPACSFLTTWGSATDLNGPAGIALDGAGAVYVTDFFNDRIRKYDADGVPLATWGSHGSGDGQFVNPYGIAIDGQGRVYVSDTGNDRIEVFDGVGTFLGAWGTPGAGDGQFATPAGVAIGPFGDVYVTDFTNHRVERFAADWSFVAAWGSLGSGNGQFYYPGGVATDVRGNVYVADTSNNRIQQFDAAGIFQETWGGIGSPYGIAVDGGGIVYVSEYYNDRIRTLDAVGTFLGSFGTPGFGPGQFINPRGLAIDISGYVYVADHGNDRIQKFTCP